MPNASHAAKSEVVTRAYTQCESTSACVQWRIHKHTHTDTHKGTYLLIDHLHNVGEVKEGSYVLALPHFLPQQLVEAQVCVVGASRRHLVSVNTPHSCRQPPLLQLPCTGKCDLTTSKSVADSLQQQVMPQHVLWRRWSSPEVVAWNTSRCCSRLKGVGQRWFTWARL